MNSILDHEKWLISNDKILELTTQTFLILTLLELTTSIAFHSLSLFADAICMLIDVLTYCTNIYAERVKATKGNS